MNLLDLFAKLSMDSSEFKNGMNEADNTASSFASSLSSKIGGAAKAVGTAMVGITAAAGAVGTAMIANTASVAAYGDSIDKASQKIGISSTAYQEWEAVLQHSGTSMTAMTGTFKTLANAAQDASSDQQAAFERIGLSMDQISSMSADELFGAVITGLQGMEEGTERTALATTLLGRGAMELGPLLNTSAEDTEAMKNAVHDLGGVLDEDAVKMSAKFQDNLQDLKTGLGGMKNEIGLSLMPALNTFMEFGISKMPEIREAFSGAFETINGAVEGAVNFVSDHFDEISVVITTVLDNVQTAFGIAWDFVTSVFDSVRGAVAHVVEAFQTADVDTGAVWDSISSVVSYAGEVIGSVITEIGNIIAWLVEQVNTDGSFMNEVFNALQTVVTTVFGAIQTVIETVGPIIHDVLQTVGDFLSGDFSAAAESAQKVFEDVFGAVQLAVETAIGVVSDVIGGIVDFFKNDVGEALAGVQQAFEGAFGFIADVVGGAGQFISGAWNGLTSLFGGSGDEANSAAQNYAGATDEVTKAFASANTDGSKSMDELQSETAKVLTTMQTDFETKYNAIKNALDSALDACMSRTDSAMSSMESSWYSSLSSIYSYVSSIMSNISAMMNQTYTVHINTVSSGGGGGRHAKAMNNAWLLASATDLSGITGRSGDIGGEAGREMLVGETALYNNIRNAAGINDLLPLMGTVVNLLNQYLPEATKQPIMNVDGKMLADSIAGHMDRSLGYEYRKVVMSF